MAPKAKRVESSGEEESEEESEAEAPKPKAKGKATPKATPKAAAPPKAATPPGVATPPGEASPREAAAPKAPAVTPAKSAATPPKASPAATPAKTSPAPTPVKASPAPTPPKTSPAPTPPRQTSPTPTQGQTPRSNTPVLTPRSNNVSPVRDTTPPRSNTQPPGKNTKDGYKAAVKEKASYGAPAPIGIDDKMELVTEKDLTVAFDALDLEREGSLDPSKAKDWLRAAGWCTTDRELDSMLNGGQSQSKYLQQAKRRWNLKQLMDLNQSNKKTSNCAVETLQQALRKLANNKGRIAREKLQEFFIQDAGLDEESFLNIMQVVGLSSSKMIEVDLLAYKMLDRICKPPSALELHEFAQELPELKATLYGGPVKR